MLDRGHREGSHQGRGRALLAPEVSAGGGAARQVSSRNAQFQAWQALLTNRNKRQRLGLFLIHGVRPISLAVEYGWPLNQLLYAAGRRPSSWADDLIRRSGVPSTAVAPELLAELGERDSTAPELIAVGKLRPDHLDRLATGPGFLGVAFDRATNPGNIGALIRSADAFGGAGVIITGHAADLYDPKSVRASTGSMFRLPAVRVGAPGEVLDWVAAQRERGVPIKVVGTDEHGDTSIADCDLTGPVLLVVGNETVGMSRAWRELCDEVVSIPIGGAASSLNAASAGTLLLYEAARQRGFPSH
ncbi:tRNA G18 (ribose-2'-O)-methylase SpoU [Kitasatospora sp. MAP12-15]|uniref:TrmH family RNA methyltransferase n=1 Tax=unclassified Kitasatospora TaxID=2633591 RepID=UPI002474E2BF|nr:TrmH family RNA methyltransferase [Kitasatospora sp. MAP12-44]MDH6112123.1 tRNA G18 (ribose-2'-O)-methylase SpoU [Kitasatospora sp. MAP12-44]